MRRLAVYSRYAASCSGSSAMRASSDCSSAPSMKFSRYSRPSGSARPPNRSSVARAVHVLARERQRAGALVRAAGGEHLLDRDPALLEGVRAAGEVGAPDAQALLAGMAARSLEVRFQPARPVPEGLRVVQPQGLDIHDLEAGGGHLLDDQREVRQLAVREHVPADEIAAAQADGAALGIDRG